MTVSGGRYVDGFGPHAFPPVRELIEGVVVLAPDAFVLAVAAGHCWPPACSSRSGARIGRRPARPGGTAEADDRAFPV